MKYTIDQLANSLRHKSLGKKGYIDLLSHESTDSAKAAWKKHDERVAHAVIHAMKGNETEGHKGRAKPSYGCASKHKIGLTGSPKEGSALFLALEKVRETVRDGFMKAKLEKLTIAESGLYFHEFTQAAKELYAIPLSFRKERDGALVFTSDSLVEYGIAWDAEVMQARKEVKEEETEEAVA